MVTADRGGDKEWERGRQGEGALHQNSNVGGVSDADSARHHNELRNANRNRGQRPLPQSLLVQSQERGRFIVNSLSSCLPSPILPLSPSA
jgi:hypothetical protein